MAQHRFQKGNKFGHGNPNAVKMHEYQSALFKAVGKSKFRALVNKIYERAMKGDMIAAKILVERLCGKLKDNTEITVSNNDNKELTIKLKTDDGNRTEDQQNTTTVS